MSEIFESIMEDPVFWKIASVVIFLVLVASFKKLFKLASALFFILVIYFLYLSMSSSEPKDVIKELEKSRDSVLEEVEKVSKEIKEKNQDLKPVKTSIKKPKKTSMMDKLKEKENSVMDKFKKEEESIMDNFKKEEKKYMDRFKDLDG